MHIMFSIPMDGSETAIRGTKLCPTSRLDVMSLPVDCVLQSSDHTVRGNAAKYARV